ncbi:MAG: endolytic transglycosylase MltG [Candidatus Levybacteria bacterium CG_4_9_14_3_um_filter_35_16]|nr:MAG: hypothetical protein COW87_04675 [Candidatus Levybacteria bacterium CG22_combo_CG10-13_8_21_14_all_35_11]PIY95094.1 MAG: endolytic transglycosylase MltG [Candidatus Levybacteria bacterium CG_4_10_14_0_8_um_filter_35_23]PJA90881.1 MAG: endolytic transglycosylase MltG [Candidatus Levybacteria bacterium CG_4_9_14_3_um_filter_35_16]PJC54715.1 MAG: endolytic transglycosylase MltG [Candidatus Levybacteria bacterium CG_4_9_14_0_2_um_filter_35_21]
MKKLFITFAIGIIVAVIATLWWKNGTLPVNSKASSQKIFVVRKGQGVREISYNLKQQGLIKDPIIFFIITKKMGYDKKIEAGDFRLSPSMNTWDIANSLTHGTLDIWVTIPEGKRTEEVAEILKKNIPTFQQSWIQSLITDEGYLFPDTYLIPKDATIDLISTMMKDNFQQKFDSAKNTKITNLTDRETIIMASLVEREAKADIDRPMVASVIYNRISIDMKLDIDATLQYALGYQTDEKRWWKKELTSQDKTINSPYNTYTNPGLPPGPISNPGLASIKASLNPAKTDYLFYISDANGTNHYAKTMAEHNANIKKYGL